MTMLNLKLGARESLDECRSPDCLHPPFSFHPASLRKYKSQNRWAYTNDRVDISQLDRELK